MQWKNCTPYPVSTHCHRPPPVLKVVPTTKKRYTLHTVDYRAPFWQTLKYSFPATVSSRLCGPMLQRTSLLFVPSSTFTSIITSSIVWLHIPHGVLLSTSPERSSKWDIFESTFKDHALKVSTMASRISRLLARDPWVCLRYLSHYGVSCRPRRPLYASVNMWNSLITFHSRSSDVATWGRDDGGTGSGGDGKWKIDCAVLTLAGALVLCDGYRNAKGTEWPLKQTKYGIRITCNM